MTTMHQKTRRSMRRALLGGTTRRSMRRALLGGTTVAGLLAFGIGGWAATTELSGAVIAPGSRAIALGFLRLGRGWRPGRRYPIWRA
jgi:hypothetical protein